MLKNFCLKSRTAWFPFVFFTKAWKHNELRQMGNFSTLLPFHIILTMQNQSTPQFLVAS